MTIPAGGCVKTQYLAIIRDDKTITATEIVDSRSIAKVEFLRIKF